MGICKDRVSCEATLASALLLLVIHVTHCLADDSALPVRSQDTLFKVEGKVAVPDHLGFTDWLLETRILFNYGQYVAYLRRDGSWEAHVPTGSYVVEAASKDLLFEPLRLDVSSRGKARARRLQLLQPGAVNGVPYPLKMKARMPAKYFQVRETWRITDFLFSPMVLMMVLPLLLIMVLPQLVDTSDPDVQREMRESLKMPKYDLPDLSEVMATWFGSGAKKPARKAVKKKAP